MAGTQLPAPGDQRGATLSQQIRRALLLPAERHDPFRLNAADLARCGGWLGVVNTLAAADLAAVRLELAAENVLHIVDAAGDFREHATLRGPGAEAARIPWANWREPEGLSLALLGPDGTGKSTIASAVCERIGHLFAATNTQHLRPGLLPELRRLLNPRKWGTPAATVVVTDPHAKPPAGALSSLLRLAYYSGDYALGYVPRVHRPAMRGELLIFDRYHADLLADPLRWRIATPQNLRAWAVRQLPRPDLLVLLDAPAELLVARKPELPVEEVARQSQIYRQLVSSLPEGHLVSVVEPAEVVAQRVCGLIVEHQRRRVSARLRAAPTNHAH